MFKGKQKPQKSKTKPNQNRKNSPGVSPPQTTMSSFQEKEAWKLQTQLNLSNWNSLSKWKLLLRLQLILRSCLVLEEYSQCYFTIYWRRGPEYGSKVRVAGRLVGLLDKALTFCVTSNDSSCCVRLTWSLHCSSMITILLPTSFAACIIESRRSDIPRSPAPLLFQLQSWLGGHIQTVALY